MIVFLTKKMSKTKRITVTGFPVVIPSVSERKLDFFGKYANDDSSLPKKIPEKIKDKSFNDDTNHDYRGFYEQQNLASVVEKVINDNSFIWQEDLSLMIGTGVDLQRKGMLGEDGKILPIYKKQILEATGYNKFKEDVKLKNLGSDIPGKLSKNPFLILDTIIDTFSVKIHLLTVVFEDE